MPTRHVVKSYDAPAFYHVYNRASGERKLFRDADDRKFFMTLLQKYLAENQQPENNTKAYEVETIAYCLMGTHFHLLLFQECDTEAISGFMRSLGTAYSMYYNKKYHSKGHVFQSSYRASHIDNEAYLAHITRYIHLNPRFYAKWCWSSYAEYVGTRHTDWIHPERALEISELGGQYACFVANYADIDRRKQQATLGSFLAG